MPSSSPSSIFPKGSKQSVHSVTSFRFTQSASIRRQAPHSSSLPSAPFRSFVHTLFAFTSGLARGPLSKLAGKQCKHSQLQSLRNRFADPPLCASACFRRWAHRCSKHSFCISRQTFPSSTSWNVNEKCIWWVSQLKTVGTQKVSPFPPAAGHPPTTPFQKKRYAIKPLSGGLRGQPFAQHCSCPTVLRCSVGSTMAAFLGTLIGV